MLKVDTWIEHDGAKVRHQGSERTFVPPLRGTGNRLIIGEAPGEQEDVQGLPLVGGSGKWFDFACRKADIRRDDLTIINTIQCRPPQNIFPTDPEASSYISRKEADLAVHQCIRNHVTPVLTERHWKRVDILGDKPLRYIAGMREGIFKWRGSPIEIGGSRGVPTLHPAYIARDQSMLPVFINDLAKSTVEPPEKYNLHPTIQDVRGFHAKELALDIEVDLWWTSHPKITMVGISDKLYTAMVVPFAGEYIAELRRIILNAETLIGHNIIQYDIPRLFEALNIEWSWHKWNGQVYDTMLLQHLRFPDLPHDLEFVGSMFSSKPAWKSDKKDFELYCARDVDVTLQAFRQLKPMIEAEGMMNLYKYTQVPLAKICKGMNILGVKIDPERIKDVREKLKEECIKEERSLPEQLRTHSITVRKRREAPAGTLGKSGKPVKFVYDEIQEEESPWASSKQVGEYLYTTLGLPPVHDLKTNKITTGKMAIAKLYNRTKNPAIKAIGVLRKKASILNLFAKEEMLNAKTVHSHFNVHGTNSGRLSSSDPNLQNVTEAARCLYVPRHPGWSLIDVDYSGIENRLTAYFANDNERLNRFLSIPDYSEHKHAASVFFGIPYCLAPGTLVLTANATWTPVENLIQGQKLVGFDEELRGYSPKYKTSEVQAVKRIKQPCYKITTDLGVVTASAEHAWVDRSLRRRTSSSSRYKSKEPSRWIKSAELRVGDKIAFSAKPWEFDASYEAGWLGGLLDGEGYLSKTGILGYSQNLGDVAEEAKYVCKDFGINLSEFKKKGICNNYHFKGGLFENLRVLGLTRPVRLLLKASRLWEGKRIWGPYAKRATVLSVEFLGEQEVIAVQTSTKTLIANGFLSHNSEVEKDNDKDAPYGKAKRIVHGSNYGMGAKKISVMYDMDFGETKELLAKWKEALGATVRWQNGLADRAKKEGFLQTPFGRKRWFYTTSYYTESLSFLPQSSAADVIFRSMIGLMYERIGWPLELAQRVAQYVEPLPRPANLLIQVHDSLIWECPTEIVPQVVGALKRVMEQPWKELGGFTLPIGIAVGPSWGEVEKYKGPIL